MNCADLHSAMLTVLLQGWYEQLAEPGESLYGLQPAQGRQEPPAVGLEAALRTQGTYPTGSGRGGRHQQGMLLEEHISATLHGLAAYAHHENRCATCMLSVLHL